MCHGIAIGMRPLVVYKGTDKSVYQTFLLVHVAIGPE